MFLLETDLLLKDSLLDFLVLSFGLAPAPTPASTEPLFGP